MPERRLAELEPAREARAVSGVFLHGEAREREPDGLHRPAPHLPERIGRYRIVREIASGGMGTVYEARQEHPERMVALKVLRPGRLSRTEIRRFEYEAELLARLQHPGIAIVFEAGTFDGPEGVRPFFAMELVDGRPLLDHVECEGLGMDECVALVADICDAVHHAHQRGVIHRDLKPANVLVDPQGRPRVLDFGVARAVGDASRPDTCRTEVGQVLGTLPYMSPEQLSGDPEQVDARCDIYALGVILFELLTGRLPHELTGQGVAQAARTVSEHDAPRLSSIDRRLRGDLETIVGKTLEKERSRRYESVAALGGDLRRYLSDEPISARPTTALYQLRKLARRNRVACAAMAALLLTLVTATLGSSVLAINATAADRQSRRIARALLDTLLAAEPDPAERLVEAGLGDPAVEADLRVAIARQLRHRRVGRFDDAERHLLHAIALYDGLGAEASEARAMAMRTLAHNHLTSGRVDDARRVVGDLVALRAATIGPDHWAVDPDEELYGLVLSCITDPEEFAQRRRELRELMSFETPTVDGRAVVPQELELVVEDGFESGVLDAGWIVRPVGLVAWLAGVSESRYVVEDLVAEDVNDGNGGRYVRLQIGQTLPATGDVEVAARIGWAADEFLAVQQLLIVLVGEHGGRVAEVGLVDSWIDWQGARHAQISDGSLLRSPFDSMPDSGTAMVAIRRSGEHIVISWDEADLLIGTCVEPVNGVMVEFSHYPTVSAGRRSTFGTLWVDDVRVERAPPP